MRDPVCCRVCRATRRNKYDTCEDPCFDYKQEMAATVSASVTQVARASADSIKQLNAQREALRDDS